VVRRRRSVVAARGWKPWPKAMLEESTLQLTYMESRGDFVFMDMA